MPPNRRGIDCNERIRKGFLYSDGLGGGFSGPGRFASCWPHSACPPFLGALLAQPIATQLVRCKTAGARTAAAVDHGERAKSYPQFETG